MVESYCVHSKMAIILAARSSICEVKTDLCLKSCCIQIKYYERELQFKYAGAKKLESKLADAKK